LNFDENSFNVSLRHLEDADVTAQKLDKLLSILTPENLEMIVYDAKLLKIDTAENMKECVDVIFKNAVNSELASTFAIFCTRVLFPSVPIVQHSNKMITFKEQLQHKMKAEVENFLENQYLKNKGIKRTENESKDDIENLSDVFCKEVQKTTTMNKNHIEIRKDEHGEEIVMSSCVKKLKKTFSLFRFIGHLYCGDLVETSQMIFTVTQLLETIYCNESTLEVFSVLFKTIGGKMEIQCDVDLSEIFEKLEERRDSVPINPHTRFMIEEVYVMRLSDWEDMDERDWIELYNSFLYDIEEKLYVLELCYGK
jgi:hypothetical protein